jgi:hypothetical protein
MTGAIGFFAPHVVTNYHVVYGEAKSAILSRPIQTQRWSDDYDHTEKGGFVITMFSPLLKIYNRYVSV